MKFRSILFSALAVSALSMTSCDKDDTVNDVSGTGLLVSLTMPLAITT
jgi:hypothetical protein